MDNKEILRKARIFREFQQTEVYKELADSVFRQDQRLLYQLGNLKEPDPIKLAKKVGEIQAQRQGVNWCLNHIELIRRAEGELAKREKQKKKKEEEKNARKRPIGSGARDVGRTKIRPRIPEKRAREAV